MSDNHVHDDHDHDHPHTHDMQTATLAQPSPPRVLFSPMPNNHGIFICQACGALVWETNGVWLHTVWHEGQ